MKTILDTSNMKAALENARQFSAAIEPTATVEAGLARWLKIHSIGNKPRTIEFNKSLAVIIARDWPDMRARIIDVSQSQCSQFAERIARYSSSRYNGMVNAVRSFIPAANFIPRKRVKLPDVTAKCPSPEEFHRLLVALDCAVRGHAALVIRFLAHTGFRINEARKLKWSDVKEDHIYARAETTKNGRPRTVPFICGTREVLRQLKTATTGELILPQRSCKTAMKFAAELSGLPRYGHHTFRHYFATRCIVSGVDIPTVAKWLGHTDGGVMLLRTYCHLMDEHSRAMAKRVSLGLDAMKPESFVAVEGESFERTSPGESQTTPPAKIREMVATATLFFAN